MKKFILLTAATLAALAFNACEKTGGSNEGGDTDPNFTENDGSFTYYGETYKTVTLENGSVWMAEPLRYIPEGYTVSSDPKDGNAHIWYPYVITDGKATAATDEETIKSNGYLYDIQAVFGTEITADNCGSFEGTQGICPKGWHIPSRADFLALCGYSNKADGEDAPVKNEDAVFYDAGYEGWENQLHRGKGSLTPWQKLSGSRELSGADIPVFPDAVYLHHRRL